MPRIARFVLPGHPHHALQRGNNRQPIFLGEQDYTLYLELLREESERHGLRVLAYCLLPDHVHLVALPTGPESLARAVGRAHFRYAQLANRAHGRSGHLWQDRFASCLLEGPHVREAIHVVERNPVRAGLVKLPWQWNQSSALAHTGEIDFSGVLDIGWWGKHAQGVDWRTELRRKESAETVERLMLSTTTGRPLTSAKFLERLETTLGRRLHALPPGRPRKKAQI